MDDTGVPLEVLIGGGALLLFYFWWRWQTSTSKTSLQQALLAMEQARKEVERATLEAEKIVRPHRPLTDCRCGTRRQPRRNVGEEKDTYCGRCGGAT